jgi:2-phosphosulfolactate phosphatase
VALVHLVEGERGCREAVDRGAIAVVVDALCTSATLPWMFELGAEAIYAAPGLNELSRLRERYPEALLAGEHGGVRIPGFHLGNSPAELRQQPRGALRGRVVLFSSSAGSRRLVEAGGAPEVYVGSPVNARRVALHVSRRAADTGRDVFVIAAGHPERGIATPEDLWAAAYLISQMECELSPESQAFYDKAVAEVLDGELGSLYRQSPNAKRLARLGHAEDIALAAVPNAVRAVPQGDGLVGLEGGASALRLTAADLGDFWLRSRA